MAFLGVYRAIYDYKPQADEELEIHEGDLLFVVEKGGEDDWWKCKKKAADEDDDEPEGLVPNTYIEEATPTHTAKALYDYTKQTDEELSFKEDARLDIYDESDPDWTLAGCNGEYGFVPSIYIDSSGSAPSASAPPAIPQRPSADDEPLPGEADYMPPSASGPAAALAAALKTGAQSAQPPRAASRNLASAPRSAPVYTPDESEEEAEDEEQPPPKPARPQSQGSLPSPPVQSPVRSPTQSQYVPSGTSEAGGILPTPPPDRSEHDDGPIRSPGGYHLYNIHEMVSYMGKARKLPMTLGINVAKGEIMVSPEKSRDGQTQEWTAEKLTHYSIEGKHVFMELVRPSKSVDFHAGAKDTANEIVAHLGELAGASRAEGLKEVLAASKGTGADGLKRGQMYYDFQAQGDDEVTIAAGDEVIVLDDMKSEEWWMVRRLKTGKEGVVPSSYVEITGTIQTAPESVTGLNAARSTVAQNRLEEERLTKEATKKDKGKGSEIPERGSSLGNDTSRSRKRSSKDSQPKSKPNPSRLRTWTDRSGTFKVEAEFIGLREGKIHLHKTNGVKIAVPVAKMAVEDIEYVERATGASLDDDKPLSDIKRRSTQRGKANGAGATIERNVKDEDYWFEFFLEAGVSHQVCGRYAAAFARDQMGPEVLPEVNESLLRTLGLKEGDILRVMKAVNIKYGRQRSVGGEGDGGETNGGLFSGPGGALKNNTRKGRPAPAIQTNDVVSEEAFKSESPTAKTPTAGDGAQRTILASAPAREPISGFEDDAWDVKPARTQTPDASKSVEAPKTAEAQKPLINDDIASLSITSPPLQPTAAPAPVISPPPALSPQNTAVPAQPQGANKEIFDKIAALAPARQRPQPPPQQLPTGAALSVPPPPRASSAPGFPPQQNSFGPVALQPQLTGYGPQQTPQQTGFQQPQQIPQQLQPQQTAFQSPPGYGAYQGQQPNGFPQQPQQTGIRAMQQNYPALNPQPTGLNFQPQSQFGQQAQNQHYGGGPTYQQQLINGAQTGSPFADPPMQPYQPSVPSGLQNSFAPQQTGFQPQPQQSQFNISQPTGLNGFQPQPLSHLPPQQQQPNFPPQQTGGVFGPSQPLGLQAPPAPLVAQRTGPPPPVRFGVQGGSKLAPQPTGRANLAKATAQNPFGF